MNKAQKVRKTEIRPFKAAIPGTYGVQTDLYCFTTAALLFFK
jgi:hypothetical protein